MNPIFIFSLPRSGSTLLQRILATSNDIATASEPWLLIPTIYALRSRGIYAEYGHYHLSTAVTEFCEHLPGGQNDYYAAVRDMALQLYAGAAGPSAKYFLDKTPRYHLICEEIIRTFPDAKFIFLWRNPLAIIASMIESSGPRKNWNLFFYKVDLFDGLMNLIRTRKPLGDRVIDVSYESLILRPEDESRKIFDYLGLNCTPEQLRKFSDVQLPGTMGDPTGTAMYRELSTEPLVKWKAVLANSLRKSWCKRYLQKIGKSDLAEMGYDMEDLLVELEALPNTRGHTISDAYYMAYGAAFSLLEPYILKRKFSSLRTWSRVHAHT